MNEWESKLRSLIEGLHLVDAESLIARADVETYQQLGEMIYQNGANNHQRIRELEQKCEKLREERNAVRVTYEQPLLLRARELESINADLYEALKDAMRSSRKDFATKEDFESAYPEQVAALAKARSKMKKAPEPPR